MPRPALIFRWCVGLLGIVCLAIFAPWLPAGHTTELLALLIVSVAAELWLTLELPRRRFLSLSGVFTFVSFLSFGPAGAALVNAGSVLLAQLIRQLNRSQAGGRPGLLFVVFNTGQIALCALVAGGATSLLAGTAFNEPPAVWTLPLLIYLTAYLAVNVTITSIATALRYDFDEVRDQFWPYVSLWSIVSVAISGPLALVSELLAGEIGLLAAVLVTFLALGSLNYILRLNMSYSRANAELTVLNEVGSTLAASLELGTLFPSIYRGTAKLMDVDGFYIALVDDDRREVHYSYLVEGGIEVAPRTLPFGAGLVSRVVANGEPLSIGEVDRETASGPAFGRSGRPKLSLLIAPLLAGERVIGAISAQSYQAHAYTPRQLPLLVAIGRVAAIAIRNAQLFDREKELLREREEFVSLVAHELKNPIAAIMGYHQIAVRRLRPDDDGLRKPLRVIAEQTDRLNRLVGDLLDLSRADAGRLALERQPADLGQIIRQVVDEQQLQSTNHRLEVSAAAPLPTVSADPIRIGQVLQNLIGNAIKYSPEGGRIEIRTGVWSGDDARWPEHLRHQAAGRASWAVVETQDEGMGIAEADLPHVFSRFFRANNTLDGQIAGVGLGLSICAELVRAHGGLIWVRSKLGEGSTFAFALPV